MLKRFFAMAVVAVGGTAMAQPTVMSLDILDGADSGAPSPAGVVVLDAFSDGGASPWTASGVRCVTSNGASLIYRDGDANTPGTQPQLVNTGSTNNRFVTMISRPRARNAAGRFDNGAAAIAGGYDPASPPPGVSTPSELNIAFFASPPMSSGDVGVDGYVLRIALDVTGVPGWTPLSTFTLRSVATPGAGTLVASIEDDGTGVDTVGLTGSTFSNPTPTGIDGYLYLVPEPTSLVLLALGALALRRR
jgi:hypothetical protein